MNPDDTLEFWCLTCKATVDAKLTARVEVVDRALRAVKTTTYAKCPHCGGCISSDSDYPAL